ncbi:MAG TPA: iron-sulfur cluster assembly scaffold protein [Thermotogota bacterium]|nr:iron-sulfur cluster assembly scaffold protein [Thermotogota bacterium]HPR94931.1 iron-sulfur cluster assembly scaffold protein [Thermotogota bacterium]
MAVIKYTATVIEHFKNPRNVGEIENPDGNATVGSPACGDQVSVSLKVNDNKIEDIKFLSYGCASNIATGSIVTELAKGKTVEEAKKMTWKDAVDELGGLPPVKVHCSVLAVDGLRAAIKDYEEKKLGIKHEKTIDESSILEELKSVIYPKTGKNIIDEKLIKYLKFEDGKVEIEISFDETDVYRQNVLEEIDEHLHEIKEIQEIDVKVVEY